jgi:hypothetical protein
MAVCYSLWSFVIFFPIWYVCTKKNLVTLLATKKRDFYSFYKNLFTHFGASRFVSSNTFEAGGPDWAIFLPLGDDLLWAFV